MGSGEVAFPVCAKSPKRSSRLYSAAESYRVKIRVNANYWIYEALVATDDGSGHTSAGTWCATVAP